MKRFAKTLIIAMMLMAFPLKQWGQTPRQIKVSELGIGNIETLEERVFLIHSIHERGYFCYKNNEKPNTIDVYVANDSSDDLSDFDFFYNNFLYNELNSFRFLEKETKGELFVQWRQELDDDIFQMLYEDFTRGIASDNATCETALPFCTDNGTYTFPAGVNSGSPCGSYTTASCSAPYACGNTPGQSYNCLSTAPNPAFYYLKIANTGNLDIKIYSQPRYDIDFDCWGPFDDPQTACNQLSCSKIVDCSYAGGSSDEHCHINNAVAGKYYLLLLTNFGNQPCNIIFENVGTGTTDCGIMPPLVDNDGPYCVGETIHLTANGQSGATYNWTGPGGFTSNQQNPTRPNCTMAMAGTYTCTISLGGQTNSATTDVVVYPQPTANFTATTVCKGEPTVFTNTSTTNPAGQQITSYHWNFGDGQTSTQQNPTHTYAQAGPYNVTLTVSCGNGHCTSTKTQTVTVAAAPVANAGPDQTIPYNTSAQLNGSGGAGTFSFRWEPANKVLNPNAQNTQTVTLTQDQTYTLTVSNAQGQCIDTDQVTIHIQGSALTVTANASPSSICMGGSTQLSANAGGGSGNSTYSWSPTTGLSNPNIYNPIATPTQTTTYTCTVTNAATSQTATATVTVTVNDIIVEHEYATICPDEVYTWYEGTPCTSPGSYEYNTTTEQGCEKTIYLHLDHYPTYDETIIDTAICHGESYTFYGTPYTSSISTSYTDQTVHGCDSIVRLNLTVYDENTVEVREVTVCPEQLPYVFYDEEYYEDTDVTVIDTDEHGCDKPVRLILQVRDYYMPDIQTEYVCYEQGETPTYIWNPYGNYTFELHESDEYVEILPTESCEGIFRLQLHFEQVPEVEHTFVEDVCDRYYWPIDGQTYTASGTYEHSVPMAPYPCNKEYRLHLTLYNSHTDAELQFDNECDEVPFTWFGENPHIIDNGTFNFSDGATTHGCDTAMRVTVSNMRYTPNPTQIRPTDAYAVVFGDTIAVVTETEFFSFNYDFYVTEQGRSLWDECVWSISDTTWRIEQQFAPDRKNSTCKVYVKARKEHPVELTCKVRNSCMEPGEYKTHKFYLKSSYIGLDEYESDGASVSIVPNPNGGQMRLNFEQMQGRVNVKVFDMRGNKIDSFETNVTADSFDYEYNMKRYAEGVYLFVINDSKRSLTRKVVVIH